MEADFPQSAREAQDHIRQIRRDKGLGDGPEQVGNNASDLESALNILSHDLYQTSTHFLLELIQNADDNFYTAETPTLSISYLTLLSSRRVRIDCNERGFAKQNVEAICRICKSTKSGRSKSAGFVGEKGIGFKAVFKVASTVWISSGHYSFRFDRDGHLGMIAPIWDNFPEKSKQGYTSILLELDKSCDEKRIINEMESYDEKILLFLRRLRRLEIDCKPGIFSLSKSFTTVLSRHGQPSENPSMMTLMNNGAKRHYFVWRHVANRLPSDSRRPGIASSEVVLAFPNSGTNGDAPVHPVVESQNVYAFLPIRNYGFPFLLQADFLLPANREDVHLDSAWNKALAQAAAAAYVESVRHMGNLKSSLRYSWVRYLPTIASQSTFFEDLRQDMLNRLRSSDILESMTGRKRNPASLIMVPKDWRDSDGRPFMINKSNQNNYVAGKYDDGLDQGYLSLLGIKLMDRHVFHEEMAKVLQKHPASFLNQKSKQWHVGLARTLLALDVSLSSDELPIVPLRDGSWVAANSFRNTIHFPSSESALTIPEGIEMQIVDAEAAADPDRMRLFERLGVTELQDHHIRTSIIITHNDTKFKPDALRPAVLVSHAEFLFNNQDTLDKSDPNLWMAADLGFCRRGNVMYLPSRVSSAAFSILPRGSHQQYGFLHPVYLEAGGSDKGKWLKHLRERHGVSVYPRIMGSKWHAYTAVPESIHDDFRLIMRQFPSRKWLTLLRDGWDFYERSLSTRCQGILKYLRSYEVDCTGSVSTEQIQKTYAPNSRLINDYGCLAPFLDIPDSADPRWKPLLDVLMVGSEDDFPFYLTCLKSAKKTDTTPVELIRHIMRELEDRCNPSPGISNAHLLVDAVRQEQLILIPPKSKNGARRWVSQGQCFWRGESWLTQSVGIERLYPDLETFFRTHLSVPNARVEHLIREAVVIPELPQPAGPRIQRLFLALTSHVKSEGLNADQKMRLRALKMFPIATTPENEPYEYLSSATCHKPWLIADRTYLRTQFQSVMPVLAFSTEFIWKINRLLVALGLEDRFLSSLAVSITEAHGNVQLHKDLTQRYRSRRVYLFRLMKEDQSGKYLLRSSFRGVEVFTCEKVIQYWHAPLGLERIQSTLADGTAFLEHDYAGHLRIYLHSGYETEMYPCELAERLRNFFNIPIEHRDLLTVALTAPEERLDKLFEDRGIAPLVENRAEIEELEQEEADYAPVHRPVPSKKSRLRLSESSRFNRLLSHTRFSPSFFRQSSNSANSLPSYDAAVARSTQNVIGRPAEPRTFMGALTLPSLKGALKDLEFVQKPGAVIGTPISPPSILDRVRGLAKRDSEIGEMIVSDILAAVLGLQYDRERMWASKDARGSDCAAFNFIDTQGRFSSFLMRLDGMLGKAQGYTRLIYHLDVKATDAEHFKITQDELDRARKNSVHSQPHPDEAAPSRHVSVLVHISDVRREPKIRFLADPWDLFEDGQLVLENARTYQARLNLRLRQTTESGASEEVGFDALQFRPPEEPIVDDPSPEYEKGKGVIEGKGSR